MMIRVQDCFEQVDGALRRDRSGHEVVDDEQPHGLVGVHVLVVAAVGRRTAAVEVLHDVGEPRAAHGEEPAARGVVFDSLKVAGWDCGGDLGPRQGYTEDRMYSTGRRKLAIETYVKFDLSAADTVAGLGYPTRRSPRARCKDHLEHGKVRLPKRQREPKFTLEMRRAAVDYHLAHGRSLARTMRKMGYPASGEYLRDWIDELAPGQRRRGGANPQAGPIPLAEKVQAVAEPDPRSGTAAEVAAGHGVSRTAPCAWRGGMMVDNVGGTEEEGVPASRGFDDLPDDTGALQEMLREARMRLRKVRHELDVRRATLGMVKKTRAPTRSC